MIRAVLLTIAMLLGVSVVGWLACVAVGWNWHPASLLTALGVCLVAVVAAFVPMALTRSADQAAIAQAGLVSTVLHMFVAIAGCGVVLMTGKVEHRQSFVYWVLAFYFATLIIVAASAVRAIRNTRRATTSSTGDASASVNRD